MSRIIRPNNNPSHGTGNIILNTTGIETTCKLYCEILGIDYDTFTATHVDFGDLLKLHLEQVGTRPTQSSIHALLANETSLTPLEHKSVAGIISQIINKETMASRHISRGAGNQETLIGAPDYSSISTSNFVFFASAVKSRLQGVAPLMPEKIDSMRAIDVFKTELGLTIPEDKSVSAEVAYMFIRYFSKKSDAELGYSENRKKLLPGTVTTEKARVICEKIKQFPGALSAIKKGMQDFFIPKNLEIAGHTLSVTPIAFIEADTKLGKWRCDMHITHLNSSQRHLLRTDLVCFPNESLSILFKNLRSGLFPIRSVLKPPDMPDKEFHQKMNGLLAGYLPEGRLPSLM